MCDDLKLDSLIKGCAEQKQSALIELYEATSPWLFALLLGILRERRDAEDALQDVFIKIWQKSDSYDAGRGRGRTWLAAIARYHALDQIRYDKRIPASNSNIDVDSIAPNESEAFQVASGLDGEHFAHRLEMNDVLTRCLKRLDELSSDCIVKAYIHGYTHEELSDEMSKPLGTVKSWIRRGLLSLRDCVNGNS